MHPDKYSHGPSTQKRRFSKQGWPSDDFGLRSPVIQKTKQQRKCATFIVERVLSHFIFPAGGLHRQRHGRVFEGVHDGGSGEKPDGEGAMCGETGRAIPQ